MEKNKPNKPRKQKGQNKTEKMALLYIFNESVKKYPAQRLRELTENVCMINGYNTVYVMGFLFKFCEDLISWAQMCKMHHKLR